MRPIATTLGLSALLYLAGTGPALACGGFFCRTQPIDQAGEKIVFGVDQDKGETVAIIQIQYTGKAEEFSWVIPTPAVPTVGVSSDELFQRLGPPTRPQFRLKYKTEGTCKTGDNFAEFGRALSPSSAGAVADSGGVQVISQEKVGPFDATVLLPDDSEALVKWLNQNDYRIPDNFGTLAASYIQKKNYFVALKLQRDKDTGDLRPVVLKMQERYPCVPIRLTAIAATDDMPIILWVFGKSRAIPSNYLHVKLNEALIDWVGASPYGGAFSDGPVGIGLPFGGRGAQPAPNYDAVVTQSMKEAGGNGFVTEYATASTAVKAALDFSYDIPKLAGISDPKAFLQELMRQGFPRGGLMQNILRTYLPLPDDLKNRGYDEMRWWNELFFGGGLSTTQSDFAKFDPAKFAAELDETFVKPLKDAQDLLGRMPYLTRLYTTMSPADMANKDPLFAFNSKLADVSNIHEADATVLCNANFYPWQAPYRITLQDGTQFTVERDAQNGQYSPLPLTSMPAAFRIEQLAEESDTELVKDNKPKIDEVIRSLPAPNLAGPSGSAGGPASGTLGPGCACKAPNGAQGRAADTGAPDTRAADLEGAFWGVAIGAITLWRRRRKSI